jgi:hypothetical protein
VVANPELALATMSKPSIILLPDVSPCFLVDSKLQWNDFKKTLRQAAMTWGFRQWFNTTVLGSPKWKEVKKLGVIAKDENGNPIDFEDEAGAEADNDVASEAAEEADGAESNLSERIMKIMGYSESEVDYFQANIRFVNVLTGVLESPKDSIARQKLWSWMVKSLHGPHSTPGPYYYLAEQVTHTDVAALYQQLVRVIDTPTMVSQADDLAAVFFYKFDPQTQDIFSYYGEVKRLVRRVHDLNPHLPKECQIQLPDTIVRALLLRAMRSVPLYQTVLDQFIIKSPDEWKNFSTDDLYKHLEQVSANSRGVTEISSNDSHSIDFIEANAAQVRKAKESSLCFSFRDTGTCSRKNCGFIHDSQSVHETKVDLSTSVAPIALPKPVDYSTAAMCDKCGESHITHHGQFAGRCSFCNFLGHKEQFCVKKQEKPVAMHFKENHMASSRSSKDQLQSSKKTPQDGSVVTANVIFVEDTLATSGGGEDSWWPQYQRDQLERTNWRNKMAGNHKKFVSEPPSSSSPGNLKQ